MPIHSRAAHVGEIREFCDRWQQTGRDAPVLCVPTTYASVTARELSEMGVSGIIYANQPRRSPRPWPRSPRADSSSAIESSLTPLDELFQLTGINDVLGDVPWQGIPESANKS